MIAEWLPLILLFTGYVAGWLLILVDARWLAPNYQKYLENSGQKIVLTRSFLFLFVFWPLTIFIITSSLSPIGQGLVLGIGSVLGWQMWQHQRDVEDFKRYFQLPGKSQLTQRDLKRMTYGWLGLLVIMVLLLIV